MLACAGEPGMQKLLSECHSLQVNGEQTGEGAPRAVNFQGENLQCFFLADSADQCSFKLTFSFLKKKCAPIK